LIWCAAWLLVRCILAESHSLYKIIGLQPSQSCLQRTSKGIALCLRLSGLTFLNVPSTPDCPIILFLDDVHCADDTSLSLLQSIMKDPLSLNMLIIYSYSSDESDVVEWLFKIDIYAASDPTATLPDILM
jgi:predicted ATPase